MADILTMEQVEEIKNRGQLLESGIGLIQIFAINAQEGYFTGGAIACGRVVKCFLDGRVEDIQGDIHGRTKS